MKFSTLSEVKSAYQDTPETHLDIWNTFKENVNSDPVLKDHRDVVEHYGFGYGDRPLHWAWKLIVDAMPDQFSFCEIGVFQGQILSLVKLLANNSGKASKIVGITPLNTTGDRYQPKHAEVDYVVRIGQLHTALTTAFT